MKARDQMAWDLYMRVIAGTLSDSNARDITKWGRDVFDAYVKQAYLATDAFLAQTGELGLDKDSPVPLGPPLSPYR